MSTPLAPPPEEAVEDAMRRVLEAERRARDAVAGCEQEAARTLDEARARARRIAERADARVQALHVRCADSLARELARLRATAKSLCSPELDPSRLARLDGAVQALAAQLGGEAP
jgi:F0F1-type ATP synthase membrane subunit b/b'